MSKPTSSCFYLYFFCLLKKKKINKNAGHWWREHTHNVRTSERCCSICYLFFPFLVSEKDQWCVTRNYYGLQSQECRNKDKKRMVVERYSDGCRFQIDAQVTSRLKEKLLSHSRRFLHNHRTCKNSLYSIPLIFFFFSGRRDFIFSAKFFTLPTTMTF